MSHSNDPDLQKTTGQLFWDRGSSYKITRCHSEYGTSSHPEYSHNLDYTNIFREKNAVMIDTVVEKVASPSDCKKPSLAYCVAKKRNAQQQQSGALTTTMTVLLPSLSNEKDDEISSSTTINRASQTR
jgi:hypothetical protein